MTRTGCESIFEADQCCFPFSRSQINAETSYLDEIPKEAGKKSYLCQLGSITSLFVRVFGVPLF
jgi:hypothetical protein